jgi:hypothetical protein
MEIKLVLGKGIKELDEKERFIFDKLSFEYSKKIERQLKNVNFIEVYIKDYSKKNFRKVFDQNHEKAKKFSIHVKVISSTRNFDAGADDWDFARTLHKAFIKVINEIEHEFHVSDRGNGFRKFQNVRRRG